MEKGWHYLIHENIADGRTISADLFTSPHLYKYGAERWLYPSVITTTLAPLQNPVDLALFKPRRRDGP
jgi:hypothetical protein